jgi:serine phosphatase RsbU (regulator of sigma subunit)
MLKESCNSHDTDAVEVAASAAVFIDNTELYKQERSTAEALQRGLLPVELPVLPGLDIAHHYRRPDDCLVGGDWADIVPLPGGRVAIVVGDAMGHGPEAATVMVQLRAAAHVLADLDLPPEAVLGRLNRLAACVIPAMFATCVCATLDPATGSGRIARAGHLPPVLARPDGSSRIIESPAGLPLGLAEASYESTHITFPADATLALYTDGLVERRDRPFDEGIDALRQALAGPPRPLQLTCDTTVADLSQRGEDDTTLVLARTR